MTHVIYAVCGFPPRDARGWCSLVSRQHPACVMATFRRSRRPDPRRRPRAAGRRTHAGQHPGDSRARSPRRPKAQPCPAHPHSTGSHRCSHPPVPARPPGTGSDRWSRPRCSTSLRGSLPPWRARPSSSPPAGRRRRTGPGKRQARRPRTRQMRSRRPGPEPWGPAPARPGSPSCPTFPMPVARGCWLPWPGAPLPACGTAAQATPIPAPARGRARVRQPFPQRQRADPRAC